MANEKYLDLDGLNRFLSNLKSYIEEAAPRKIECTLVNYLTQEQIADLQVGDVIVETVAGKILFVSKVTSSSKRADMIEDSDGIGVRSAFFTKSNDTWNVSVGIQYLQPKIRSNSKLDSDLVDDTNQTNKFVTADFITKVNAILKYQSEQYGVIAEVINAEEYFSAPSAEISHLTTNGITLGVQDLETLLNSIVELAEGKTQNIVIDDSATGTNVVNTSFNSTNATITLTISGNKVVDVNNVNHDLSSFKVGDIISITNTNVPDRWVGSITATQITFYPLETKLNIDATPTVSSTNPVSSGGVYQALQGKQDSMTAITNTEIDTLFE